MQLAPPLWLAAMREASLTSPNRQMLPRCVQRSPNSALRLPLAASIIDSHETVVQTPNWPLSDNGVSYIVFGIIYGDNVIETGSRDILAGHHVNGS